ncbi:hypothetical protein EZS27_040584, partial [termite gut metagenome]
MALLLYLRSCLLFHPELHCLLPLRKSNPCDGEAHRGQLREHLPESRTPELLRSFTDKDAISFTSRFYHPSNMVFFVLGNIDFKRIIRQTEKFLGKISDSKNDSRRLPPLPYIPEQLTVCKDTHQAHVMIGRRGYHAYDNKRTGLYLLNNILGGPGMNSRLNLTLRERRG